MCSRELRADLAEGADFRAGEKAGPSPSPTPPRATSFQGWASAEGLSCHFLPLPGARELWPSELPLGKIQNAQIPLLVFKPVRMVTSGEGHPGPFNTDCWSN